MPEMIIKEAPFFSVITVVKNDFAGFRRTAHSIAAQTHRNFEWIVIDGASQDGTVEKIKANEKNIAAWLSEPDTGIYDAMNKGIDMACGTYTVFFNAGDIFPHERTLGDVYCFITRSECHPDVLFGGAQLVINYKRRIYRPPRKMEWYLWHGLPANHQATYYKTHLLKETTYDTNYMICGDYYIIAALKSRIGEASYLDEPIANFRVGDSSYKSPFKLLSEAYRVQKDVLKLPFGLRAVSLVKRTFSIVALMLLTTHTRRADAIK